MNYSKTEISIVFAAVASRGKNNYETNGLRYLLKD